MYLYYGHVAHIPEKLSYLLSNNNQSVNPGRNSTTMRVIQYMRSYDACDLCAIIYHNHALVKTDGLRIYAIMLPSSGFSVAD